MAQIDDDVYIKAIVDAVERCGYVEDVRSYTGRGESSRPCLAVVCNDSATLLFDLGLIVGGLHDGAMADDLSQFEIDSIGRQKVVYWPSIKYE